MALTEKEAAVVAAREAAQALSKKARGFRHVAESMAARALAKADPALAANADAALAQAARAEQEADAAMASVLEQAREAKTEFAARRGGVPTGVHLLLELADGRAGYMFAVSCNRRSAFDPGVEYDTSDVGLELLLDRSGSYVDSAGAKQWREGWPLRSWRRCELSELPKDRTFRGAWVFHEGSCVVDLPKARQLVVNAARRKRLEELKALDEKTVIAIGRGDAAMNAEIETLKQSLRDFPASIAPQLAAAQSPEDLKAIWNS
jgi:hypothetical protein